ncbi:cellobiose phosphotransferase system IIB component [Clostridiales bacterium CHKCI006]|nr:cellobiose phosphotransferase system IIB component [Clostridiales bacterium CHKCI006]
MKKVLMLCASGITSNAFAVKMNESAQKRGIEMNATGGSVSTLDKLVGTFDVLLVGPQSKAFLDKIKETVGDKAEVVLLDIEDFNILKIDGLVDKAMNAGKETKEEPVVQEESKAEPKQPRSMCKVLMICGSGITSNAFAVKMNESAHRRGIAMNATGGSLSSLASRVGSFDVLLVGPENKVFMDKIRETVKDSAVIVELGLSDFNILEIDALVDKAVQA